MSALEPRENYHLMSALLRRFRGLTIALAVLAISAGAVLATAPSMDPTSAPTAGQPTAEPTATPKATKAPKATKSPEATETPEAPEAAETPDADASPATDTHGALVSAAAQLPTPEGFANHGAFVRCVAHMDGTLLTVDLEAVTPKTCADAEAARNPEKAQRQADKAAEKAQRQADMASAGKGKGAAKQAAKGAGN